MAPFVPGQILTASQINAALDGKLDAGGVSAYSLSQLAKSTALTWLTGLGLGTGSPGSANGVAMLDGSGKLPSSALPASVTGAMVYTGAWDASANSPALVSGTGTKGFVYRVSTQGTTNLDGITDWRVGDMAVFNGTTWDKWDATTTEVYSVAGRVGDVTIAAADITNATTTGRNILTAASQGAAQTAIGLVPGTSVGQIVAVQTGGKLPALDGSNLTNLPNATNTLVNIQVFTASGTYTPSAGATRAKVTVVGGGGGGAGSNTAAGLGSGGGAGATAVLFATSLSSKTITIGAGGTAGPTGSSGGNGGTTSYGTTSAAGGTGGTFAGGAGTGSVPPGGQGGVTTANATYSLSGGAGDSGWSSSVSLRCGGNGGPSSLGGGGAGGVAGNGSDGAAPGSGGGGSSGSSFTGGNGANGIVIIEEYR